MERTACDFIQQILGQFSEDKGPLKRSQRHGTDVIRKLIFIPVKPVAEKLRNQHHQSANDHVVDKKLPPQLLFRCFLPLSLAVSHFVDRFQFQCHDLDRIG